MVIFGILVLVATALQIMASTRLAKLREIEDTKRQRDSDQRIVGLNTETESLKHARDSVRLELEQLRSSVKESKNKADSASKKSDEMQVQIKGRHLTKEQKQELKTFLLSIPNETIELNLQNQTPESSDFEKDFESVFKEAAWKIERSSQMMVGDNVVTGIGIAVKSRSEAPAWAGPLQKKLRSIGFNCPGFVDKDVKPKSLTIIIGQKP
jgi:seryl-tRNA synthetase